jgi:hypothetical protein
MTTTIIFDEYLQFRFDRSGALTPGKKIALIEQLQAEAEQGRVPVGQNKVASLPLESKSVQAVLAGENISMGATRVKGGLDISRTTQMLNRVQTLPMGQRVGLLAVIFVVLLGLTVLIGRVLGNRKPETAVGEPVITQVATAEVEVILSDSSPSKKPNDPASIEIGMTSFVLGRSKIKNGVWEPVQAEWLEGTEVRRVLAIPRDGLERALQRGDVLRVRTRSGGIVPYRVAEITTIQRTQIEALFSLEPSLAIVLYDETASSTREVVIAKLDLTELEISAIENFHMVSGPTGEINLRERPFGTIIGVLVNGTLVEVLTDAEPVHSEGYKWVRVRTNYGAEGWVAASLLAEIPPE